MNDERWDKYNFKTGEKMSEGKKKRNEKEEFS